jgi:hypothetical protein
MSLEVAIGGEIFIPHWISCSSSDLVFDENLSFFFRFVPQVQQTEGRLG